MKEQLVNLKIVFFLTALIPTQGSVQPRWKRKERERYSAPNPCGFAVLYTNCYTKRVGGFRCDALSSSRVWLASETAGEKEAQGWSRGAWYVWRNIQDVSRSTSHSGSTVEYRQERGQEFEVDLTTWSLVDLAVTRRPKENIARLLGERTLRDNQLVTPPWHRRATGSLGVLLQIGC